MMLLPWQAPDASQLLVSSLLVLLLAPGARSGTLAGGGFQGVGVPPRLRGPERPRVAGHAVAATQGPGGAPDLGSSYIGDVRVDAATAWRCVEELRRRVQRIPELPHWRGQPVAENTRILWWFLRDRRLNVDEALEKLVSCVRWRAEYRVEKLGPELFAREMRTEKGYLHRHVDVMGRPVLVATARRHNVLSRRLQESCRMCVWMLESAMDRLTTLEPPPLAPAGASDPVAAQDALPEQALGIFDLREFSPLQADLEVAAFLVDVLYKYYPGRTGRVLLVGAPDLFRAFWQNVKPWLGHYASLADFVTVDDVRRYYFSPGREPPGFGEEPSTSDALGRRVGRPALASTRVSALGSGLPPLFAGATLMAAILLGARRRNRVRTSRGTGGAAGAAWPPRSGEGSSELWTSAALFSEARQSPRPVQRGMLGGRTALKSLPGLGSRHIGEVDVDAKTACKCIEELRQQLKRLGPSLPPWHGRPAEEDEGLLWWFLRDRRLDVNAAAAKLQTCLRWRSAFRVDYLGPENFTRELRSRKAYLHQHPDVVGRPVLMVIAQRHNLMERRLEQCCQMCAWFLERTMERLALEDPRTLGHLEAHGESSAVMMNTGKLKHEEVEQALGIIDLQNFSPLQADVEFVNFLVQALHDYYPGRFSRILLVDAPVVFKSFWENVKPVLHRYRSLADFVTAEEVCSRYFAPGLAPPELQRR